jgi:hypothetical protein
LALKWKTQRPGQVHFGNDRSTYTTARFTQSGVYVLQLTAKDHENAEAVSDEVTINVLPGTLRVLAGLQALYNFKEGSGDVVHDISNVDTPLDLQLKLLGNFSAGWVWLPNGLQIVAPSILKSVNPTRLLNSLKASKEITIEAWVKPASTVEQNMQPARIVTFSADTGQRNFTLGQTYDGYYQVRLRTTKTDDNGTQLLSSRDITRVTEVESFCLISFMRVMPTAASNFI